MAWPDERRQDGASEATSLLAVRRGSLAPASGKSGLGRTSSALCASAIRVYEGVFRRVPELDPDLGLGERYEAGRRALERRRVARDSHVADDRSAAVEALLVAACDVRDGAVIDVIETLPGALLGLLDRRRELLQPAAPARQRRWADRPGRDPARRPVRSGG